MKIINFFIPVLLLLSAIPMGFAASGETVVIASTPADAILAAQYAKEMGYKFVYTPSGSLSDEAIAAIGSASNAIMIGGPDAISADVESQLKAKVSNVERVFGETRVETSLALLERMVQENPEALNNIVLAEGFNEGITPAALNFGAPILYFSPDNYEKVSAFMNSHKVTNAVVMGSSVPDTLRTAVSNAADTTNVVTGAAETIIKTALSVASNLNPSIGDAAAAIVSSTLSNDPLMSAISAFASGDVGSVVSLTSSDSDSITEIVEAVASITKEVSVLSDNDAVSDIISESAPDGTSVTKTTTSSDIIPSTGGGSSSSSTTTTSAQKYTIVSIDGTEKVKFADFSVSGTDGNNVKITGEENIVLPDVTINTNLAAKSYTGSSGSVAITYEGTGSGLAVAYPIETGAITYGSDVTATFYGATTLASQQVTAHVISDRQAFRDSINDLLEGNADAFITMLNNADTTTATTDASGDATFTLSPAGYGENIVLVTLGDGTITTTATVLGFSGFEYLKYELNMTQEWFYSDGNDTEIWMELNDTPVSDIRYGVIGITKDGYSFTLNIVGTSTADKNFDVSLVGNGGTSKIIDDSELVSITASSVQGILNAAFTDTTAGMAYSNAVNESALPLVIMGFNAPAEDCYYIGIVYDVADKNIVAMAQIEEDNTVTVL
ncbi:TIGR04279 domain-containing protein [Methanococcus maripaludis]|uniref:Methanogen extracellular protein (TIGR04279 family) n=2 Tax=Methanococcus maripaludis TaxID=39152 RepID=A0A7J9PGF8_METMI|nr:TIGR04279 domain-containing protein [Methanococcus maripaludis]MBA2862305.1 methanogen extracellular protein (TIGR04279 family) [Methanococcus maripaludis]